MIMKEQVYAILNYEKRPSDYVISPESGLVKRKLKENPL